MNFVSYMTLEERRGGVPMGLALLEPDDADLGLPVALLLRHAARALRAPPGAGYT